MKRRKRTKWLRLDNAAKVFPATSGKKDTKVFRIACELTEAVDAELLGDALEETVDEFPVFRSVLRKGLFWYYFETTERKAVVHLENQQPCSPIYDKNKRGFLFDVSYYQNRINLEVHHALTDGVGAQMFLTTLVNRYLMLAHKEELHEKEIESVNKSSIEERLDDSFHRYYDGLSEESKEKKSIFPVKAFRLHGAKLSENRIKVIEGHLPVTEIKRLAKEHNTSVTVYIVALIIQSIGESMTVREKSRRPVGIMVPVNLRSYFESSSVRNFFATINVVYDFSKRNGEFDDIITQVEKCFKEELTKEKMQQTLRKNGALENNMITRFFPLIIKDFFIRIAHDLSDRQYTFSVSNIGIFHVPKELESYIRLFSVFVSTKKKQACICSYQDKLVISFTSPLLAAEVERNFFRSLTQMEIPVEIAATGGWEE